jgi:hypothetical protein
LQRSKRQPTLRGLNDNHNHDLKHLSRVQPRGLVPQPDRSGISTVPCAKGMKPDGSSDLSTQDCGHHADRLKKGERFDPEQLKRQAA